MQTPYYIIPDIEALNTEKDPEKLRQHRRRIAANIGDPDALYAILGDASADFTDFYGTSDMPVLSTEDTIDSFLRKFGSPGAATSGPQPPAAPATTPAEGAQEMPEVPVMPEAPIVAVAPAIDYAAMLEEQSPAPDTVPADDATLGAIDAFLDKVPSQRGKPKKERKEPEMPSLTESFAKIMIKNGNYSRALEIITQISLNNPEKSIYFADQIRFLKKIIYIQGCRQ